MEKEYREFMDALVEKACLLSEAGGYQIQFQENVEIDSEAEDQIMIEFLDQEGTPQACAMSAKDFYAKQKQQGGTPEEGAKQLIREIGRAKDSGLLDMAKKMRSYEEIKDKLYVRPLNVSDHRIRHAVVRIVGDIALAACILFQEDEDTCASGMIREEFLAHWEMKREQVMDDAMENTMRLAPPRIYLWEKLLFDQSYQGEEFMTLPEEAKEVIRKDCLGNCLSTSKRTNGAVAVFYPGVARQLSRLVGSDLFLVFTSIHEAMIHSVHANDPESLKHILADTMQNTTPEKDILTERIYRYFRETDEIRCVTD